MRKPFFVFMLTAGISFILSCSSDHKSIRKSGPDALASHIDKTVKPGDDFFNYANGTWFRENPIPANEPSNGSWQLKQDTINAQIRAICETSAAMTEAPKGSPKQKIGDFFFTGMDSVTLNKQGLSDLRAELERIDAISDMKGVIREAAHIHAVSASPMLSFYVAQDDKNSGKHAIFLWQGGLSLPDRRYYFDVDPGAVTIRRQFVEHLNSVFRILGDDGIKAKASADRLMKLEAALATASRKREDTRDPFQNYHKMSFGRLMETTPDFDWSIFLEGAGLSGVDTVVVGQPEFFTALNGYLKTCTIEDWKPYLKYHFIRGLSRYLDDRTYREFFHFYSTALRGVQEPKPRWKRVVEQTDQCLGELIGQVYVKEYLPGQTKRKLLEIGKAIRSVYAKRIRELDWMSGATKEKALKKLDAINMKLGYPDKWKDLSSLEIDRTSYVRNGMNANQWEFDDMVSKFGKPVDRSEWDMEPQTNNAYYNPSNNEIVIPGCWINLPGYEHVLADDALLYANIGLVFGHEITHGFDDQGSKYDQNGNLKSWWTPEDSVRFYAKTKAIVKQFGGYTVEQGLHLNGELTQGENIADLGGITMAHEAFKKTRQYRKAEVIAGLDPDQRFFLGYALTWMVHMRPEAIAAQVKSNEHAPAQFRVNGPLADISEFYTAFDVKEGDAMWRPDSLRIKIW
jgi:putative endopeptidase